LPKKDGARAPTSKFKGSVIGKGPSSKKTARLKSSNWYEEAARSIGIGKKKPPERRDGASE
jgi:hypothetical protein